MNNPFKGSQDRLIAFLVFLIVLLTFIVSVQLRVSPASNRAYLIDKLNSMVLEQKKIESNQEIMAKSLKEQNLLLQQLVNVATAGGLGRDLPTNKKEEN